MTTTFSELVQLSASVVGTGTAKLSTKLRATVYGVGAVGAYGDGVTMGHISGGVTYSELYSRATGAGSNTATLGVTRSLQASVTGIATVRIGDGASTYLPAVASFGGDKLSGSVDVSFPAFIGGASDPLLIPNYSFSSGTLPALQTTVTGLSGSVGTVESFLYPLVGLAADYEYGGSYGRLPALTSRANDEQTAYGPSVRAYLFTTDTMMLSADREIEMADTMESTIAMVVAKELQALMASQFTSTLTMQGSAEYSLEMSDVMQYVASLAQQRVPLVWVVNTDGGANSTYTGWDFNSFAVWQGRNMAAGDDGIFELVGDTDDSTPIVSSILTGKSDLGTVQHKRMAYVYVGAKAAGGMSLTVHTDDGQVNTYDVPAAELMANVRAAIGKGLRSKYWQLELTNPDGSDFEIESLELVPDATIRRI
jgi:hypothetical protein